MEGGTTVDHDCQWQMMCVLIHLTLLALCSHTSELRYEKTLVTKNSMTNPTNFQNFYTAQSRTLRKWCENLKSIATKMTKLGHAKVDFFKNWQNSCRFKRVK